MERFGTPGGPERERPEGAPGDDPAGSSGIPYRIFTGGDGDIWLVGALVHGERERDEEGVIGGRPRLRLLVFRRLRGSTEPWREGPAIRQRLDRLTIDQLRHFLDLARATGAVRESVPGLEHIVVEGDPRRGGEEVVAGEAHIPSPPGPGEGEAEGEAPEEIGPYSRRFVFRGLGRFRGSGGRKRTYHVAVVHGGVEYIGEAEGEAPARSRAELAAEAALNALGRAEEETVTLELERVQFLDRYDRTVAVVEVIGSDGRESLPLVGACYVRDSEDEAAAIATLDAAERWLSRPRDPGRADPRGERRRSDPQPPRRR